jgi:signal peptidase I
VSDDLYSGPSVLAPGAPKHPDRVARLLVWPALLALLAAMVVFYVLYTPLRVAGESMEPALLDGDRALRTKSYETPHRGDIVVVDARSEAEDDDIVKRVVGIAGDTVEIRDDIAIVNGQVEDTSRLVLVRGRGTYSPPYVVPQGAVYVLGDNRPISLDSRYTGPVPVERVRGRLTFVFLPPDRIGAVH